MPKTQKDRDRHRKQRRQRKLRALKQRLYAAKETKERRDLLIKIRKLQPWFNPGP